MIIELQIRNNTGTELFYRIIEPNELRKYYSTQVLPGNYPSSQNSGFASTDTINRDVEDLNLMRWMPKRRIDQRSGMIADGFSHMQNYFSTIPCNMRQSIFLDDVNNTIQLYCISNRGYFITTIDVSRIMNFNILVGLILPQKNILYFFDCCGNSMIVDPNENNFQMQGMQNVTREIFDKFLQNPHFSIPAYLGTSRQKLFESMYG
jgi:hypothetical protein